MCVCVCVSPTCACDNYRVRSCGTASYYFPSHVLKAVVVAVVIVVVVVVVAVHSPPKGAALCLPAPPSDSASPAAASNSELRTAQRSRASIPPQGAVPGTAQHGPCRPVQPPGRPPRSSPTPRGHHMRLRPRSRTATRMAISGI